MERKIVAIGGGENGRRKSDGTLLPYETEAIDREIVALAGKGRPHFLLLSHALPPGAQENYFQVMKAIYGDRLGCLCRDLKSGDLTNRQKVQALVDWADIIYEGGGDTPSLMELWQSTGFDAALRAACEKGKVLCGLSAGANCWFEACSTDTLRIRAGDPEAPLTLCRCLGFLPGLFVPHCDEPGRMDSARVLVKENSLTGYCLSNCAAFEVVDGRCRLVVSSPAAYGRRLSWREGRLREENLDPAGVWQDL